MAKVINSFIIAMDKEYDEKVEGGVLGLKKKIASRVLSGFISKMPVLSGRAKANVIVSLGKRDETWGDTFDKVGTATLAQGLAVIASDRDPFRILYVQDNVPYIEALEDGHSDKAPLGIAAVTVSEVQARFG